MPISQQCTVADDATIASVEEVHDNTTSYVSASQSQVSSMPAHIFEVHTGNFSFSGGLDMEIFEFFDSKKMC